MARAKGVSNRRILWRHALRPSSLTLLTVAGLNFGTLIGGAIVVEVIFGSPGWARRSTRRSTRASTSSCRATSRSSRRLRAASTSSSTSSTSCSTRGSAVPVQPPDDDFPSTEPPTSGSDLERFAEDSVGAGSPSRRARSTSRPSRPAPRAAAAGRGLGFGAWLAIGWMVFIVVVGDARPGRCAPARQTRRRSFAECARRGPVRRRRARAPGHLLGVRQQRPRHDRPRLRYGA